MFLQLAHTRLTTYAASRQLVIECYKITAAFPADERFNLVSQIRRAALSVHLNLAEGSSRKSALERKRFYEISRGSVIEVDTALDVAAELNYIDIKETDQLGSCILKTFKLISGLISQV
ncbi:four helix bundle protein [Deminuibacter soli]|uniref:Four helix bundle protein n=1 Tax=Deminuibacter soli TaxID=2291815 RepID=A0A3E1NPM3_9BACT|nr:four helix bundle protein [Deminuibacter soli]RFM29738.1 four helix bundle protein [Deminuibacter soli]